MIHWSTRRIEETSLKYSVFMLLKHDPNEAISFRLYNYIQDNWHHFLNDTMSAESFEVKLWT